MSRLPHPPLMLVTDRRQALLPLPEIVEAALEAGCRWVSIREKDLGEEDLRELVSALRPITQRHNARLGIHGTVELAMGLELDAVHLASGADAEHARRCFGPEALIGQSIHRDDDAARLKRGILDYAIIAPAYETASKPGYGPALGIAGIGAAARRSAIPMLAMGGINAANVLPLLKVGASGCALMGDAMRSRSPDKVISDVLAVLGRLVG